MKNIDEFSSAYDSPLHGSPDVHIEGAFKTKITSLLKFASLMSLESLLARVVSLWQVFYAEVIQRLTQKKEQLIRASDRGLADAGELQSQFRHGQITEFVNGHTTFSPPCGMWAQIAFYFLLVAAVVGIVLEWANFAWWLRFFTDSFVMGLAFAFPILIIPVAEGAYLLIVQPTKRGRKVIVTFQVLAAVACAIGYAFLSLVQGDNSIASVFVTTKSELSREGWRMAFQLLTSVSVSTLCLHAAFSLGQLKPARNPEYAKKKKQLEHLHHKYDHAQKQLGEVEGSLSRAEVMKNDAVLFCTQKHEQIQTINQHQNQQNISILNEPII